MFTIAVKVYPYNSNVNSVRVVIVKQEEDGQDSNAVKDEKSSKRSRSSKARSMRSLSAKNDP